MKIAHFSDLHYLSLKNFSWKQILNKRITGAINLLLLRSKIHNPALLELACKKVKDNCDFVAITGDLTNLSLESEFLDVKATLNKYFEDEKMLIVPGNHDRYTTETIHSKTFEKYIYQAPPNAITFPGTSNTWPYLKIANNYAFIGIDSTIDNLPFYSSGKITPEQLKRLENILKSELLQNKKKIILLHHHPIQNKFSKGESFRHLINKNDFLNILKNYNIDLVLHGHNHIFNLHTYASTLIAENGSTTIAKHKNPQKLGKITLYTFQDNAILIDLLQFNPLSFDFEPCKSYIYDNNTIKETTP